MNDKEQVKEEEIRLTQYSRGAGCGCKISPEILDKILAGGAGFIDNNLMLLFWILEMEQHSFPRPTFLCRLWMMHLLSEKLRRQIPSAIYMRWAENLF